MSRFARAVFTRRSQMAIDAVLAAAAFWLAYLTRFDGLVPAPERQQFAIAVGFVAALYVGVHLIRSHYYRVWRFFNLEDASDLAVSVSLAMAISLIWRFFAPAELMPTGDPIPTGVLLIHPFLTYTGWCGARLSRRLLYQRVHLVPEARGLERADRPARKRVALVGAGEAGLEQQTFKQ